MSPQVRPFVDPAMVAPKTLSYRVKNVSAKIVHVGESPIKRFGGEYDGASADGWHCVLRCDDGTLESLAGPFETPFGAAFALSRLLAGEPATPEDRVLDLAGDDR